MGSFRDIVSGVVHAAITLGGAVAHPEQSSITTQENYAKYSLYQKANDTATSAQMGTLDKNNSASGTSYVPQPGDPDYISSEFLFGGRSKKKRGR